MAAKIMSEFSLYRTSPFQDTFQDKGGKTLREKDDLQPKKANGSQTEFYILMQLALSLSCKFPSHGYLHLNTSPRPRATQSHLRASR